MWSILVFALFIVGYRLNAVLMWYTASVGIIASSELCSQLVILFVFTGMIGLLRTLDLRRFCWKCANWIGRQVALAGDVSHVTRLFHLIDLVENSSSAKASGRLWPALVIQLRSYLSLFSLYLLNRLATSTLGGEIKRLVKERCHHILCVWIQILISILGILESRIIVRCLSLCHLYVHLVKGLWWEATLTLHISHICRMTALRRQIHSITTTCILILVLLVGLCLIFEGNLIDLFIGWSLLWDRLTTSSVDYWSRMIMFNCVWTWCLIAMQIIRLRCVLHTHEILALILNI